MSNIALLFPGQGSQFIGMGKKLYDEYSVARSVFEEANEALGIDLKRICFEGNFAELGKNENMLPGIFATSIAMFKIYMQEIGIAPKYCAGHSLGEYSALTCSGVIKFEDAIRIIRKRSLLANQIASSQIGSMTIIDGIDELIIEEQCREISNEKYKVDIACYNAPNQVAVSGHTEAVMELEDKISEMGGIVTPLMMSAPFHCKLMEPVTIELRQELEKYTYSKPKWPIVSNVTGKLYGENEEVINDLLTNQLTRPVQWRKIVNYIKNNGVAVAIELGPQTIISKLLKNTTKNLRPFSYSNQEDKKELFNLLYPQGEKKSEMFIDKCLAIAVGTVNRHLDEKAYFNEVVIPYKEMEFLRDKLRDENKKLTIEEIRSAFMLLKNILANKKVSYNEQISTFQELFNETGMRDLFTEKEIFQ